MFKGRVKFFDSREEKRFGFVVLEGFVDGSPCSYYEGEFFFHFGDSEFIIAGGKEPCFSGKHSKVSQGKSRILRDPQKDDIIVFKLTSGTKGKKCSPWGFIGQYEQAVERIAKRPVYRVFKSMGDWGESGKPGDPKDAQIVWQGSDMEELKERFPLPTGRQSPGSDPLLSFWSSDDGFEVRRWWEKQNADGSWEQCADPRDLSGVLRTFERISNRW